MRATLSSSASAVAGSGGSVRPRDEPGGCRRGARSGRGRPQGVRPGRPLDPRAGRHQPRGPGGRAPVPARSVRLREVHAAQPRRGLSAAIARALANNPSIVLMDEPFGALDAQTREVMQEELSRIQRVEHKTIVFVTHSIREAVYLADRLVVLTSAPGRIREIFSIKLGEA